MTAFLRFLASVFLLIAVIAAVYDGTRSLKADHMVSTPLVEHWSSLAPSSLEASKKAVQRNLDPLIWDVGVLKLLNLPAWALFAGLGIMLAYIGRRRRRVNVFAN